MPDLEAMKRDLLEECRDDYVGLWAVIRYVEDEFPGECSKRIREITLEVLRILLKSGAIAAGFPDASGMSFHSWSIPVDAIIERIEEQWPSTGPKPNVGEVAWFTTPSKVGIQ